MLIEIPILGGVVAVDQITSIRHSGAITHFDGATSLPRVIIDTRQLVAAFIIECDSYDTMIGVLKTMTEASIKASREAIAATAT